ncbi:MAG: HIT domain-containing protein [Candidatus Saccharimonadales bacterium]
MSSSAEDKKKQELYRDARFNNKYDEIWQNVGKCVFCDLNSKYVFYEQNGIVMAVALFAYVDGHFMIIPKRHVTSVKGLTPLEWETIRKFMYIAKKLIRDVHGAKGVQFIQKEGSSAQSTVEHIHFHCVPFDSPDLSVWNYRKLANTPVENASLYKERSKKIDRLSTKFDEKYSDGNL